MERKTMQVIIKLRGVSGAGKTMTLIQLADRLVRCGAIEITRNQQGNSPIDYAIRQTFLGKKIGIITAGDFVQIVKDGFTSVGHDCDIYVCATRTKGAADNYINTVIPGAIIVTYEKWFIENESGFDPVLLNTLRDIANESQINSIISLITSL